ncbi:MAG: DUF1298 domain-containing protein, partial [Burkholderiaceae bacterium]|nr:DUF1298 domain-containing protein [Burkholderiaceae bacterium]
NLVISNVPGPQVPIYLAGARVLANCPTSIVVHGLALNITVQSFDAHMDFGLMADAAALPDVKTLALALDAAWKELRALPAPGLNALPTQSAQPSPRKATPAPNAPPTRKVSRARRNCGVGADGRGARSR